LRVELTLRGPTPFSGVLRVAQPDADADRCISEVPVALSGDGTRRIYWLYALPSQTPRSQSLFQVSLIDEAGAAVLFEDPTGKPSARLVEQQPIITLNESEILILDISAQPLSRLGRAIGDSADKMRRTVQVARISPENLPTAWFGLEMADFIVWDAADPSALEYRQVEALIEWVRRGGHLVLAAGRTAGALSQSALGPLLPVEIGPTREVKLSPRVQRGLGATVEEVTACTVSPRPGAWPKIRYETILYTGRVGHGQISFVAAELSDLWRRSSESAATEPQDPRAEEARLSASQVLVDSLFGFRHAGTPDQGQRGMLETDLFDHVKRTVDFRARSGAFMGVAILFVIIYVLAATVGSWHWLKHRGWQKHSWAVFAVAVLAASAVSLGAVRVVRGISTELHQLSVVDLTTDSFQAKATCLFGLKTATHTSLDLWLPSDPGLAEGEQPGVCALKPMLPTVGGLGQELIGFLSPQSYQARPARAKLEDVPFRATLKQFVGQWSGVLTSRFTGELHVSSSDIQDSSWIQNALGVDLEGCYLLIARRDPQADRAASAIDVYDLGKVHDGRRIDRLGSYLSELRGKEEDSGGGKPDKAAKAATLADLHNQWARDLSPSLLPAFGGARQREIDPENYDKALLLISTLREYEPEMSGGRLLAPFLTARYCGRLDRSDALTRETAMLVGFTREAGPVRLAIRNSKNKNGDFRVIKPGEARTMYRVLIPVVR
jgi:hypothetical protein